MKFIEGNQIEMFVFESQGFEKLSENAENHLHFLPKESRWCYKPSVLSL